MREREREREREGEVRLSKVGEGWEGNPFLAGPSRERAWSNLQSSKPEICDAGTTPGTNSRAYTCVSFASKFDEPVWHTVDLKLKKPHMHATLWKKVVLARASVQAPLRRELINQSVPKPHNL